MGNHLAIHPPRTAILGGVMNKNLILLHSDLKKFGLNPLDWKLKKMKKRHYKIANINDNNFYFLGEIQQSGLVPQWAKIQLASF